MPFADVIILPQRPKFISFQFSRRTKVITLNNHCGVSITCKIPGFHKKTIKILNDSGTEKKNDAMVKATLYQEMFNM